MKKKSIVLMSVAIVLATLIWLPVSRAAEKAYTVADAAGNLHVPADYRMKYEYLGTWAVGDTAGKGSSEVHIVYASPGSIAGFKKMGHFPDGTVLVKEVFEATTAAMTTATAVSHAEKLKGWFVMERESMAKHPDNKLWANGWGWSWFDAGNMTKTTSTDFAKDCQSCHVPAKDTDWVYSNGYVVLKK